MALSSVLFDFPIAIGKADVKVLDRPAGTSAAGRVGSRDEEEEGMVFVAGCAGDDDEDENSCRGIREPFRNL